MALSLKKMYPPQKDSPSTYLMGDMSTTDTYIVVGSVEVLPQTVPFPLTIGFDKSVTETVIVTNINTLSNQLTVIRGPAPLVWVAGIKCARVLTSGDLSAIQDNVGTIATQTDINTTNIGKNITDIGKNTTDISDEVIRAKGVEASEATRATNAEGVLDTKIQTETSRAIAKENDLQNNKVNRTELTVLITDVAYTADGTMAKTTFTTYNAQAQVVGSFDRYIPVVSSIAMGVMTPEAYNEMIQLRTDVKALQQQGGRFIGKSFPTKAALDAYIIPGKVIRDDYTYVIDDETKSGSTTEYIYDGTKFQFAYVIEFDPIGIANATTPGIVKSDGGTTGGKIFVEANGTMSVIGWNGIMQNIASKVSANDAKITFQINGVDIDSITLNQSTNKTINFIINNIDPNSIQDSMDGYITDNVNKYIISG